MEKAKTTYDFNLQSKAILENSHGELFPAHEQVGLRDQSRQWLQVMAYGFAEKYCNTVKRITGN